ncbi:hypothetical protein U1737_15965 [Sphingomonas sp. LB3N6]|uniref:hypothetical protein n=1 Tax=Sphingomonas fucosidasi TaxID=3096164 RepID=UPI002FC7F61F
MWGLRSGRSRRRIVNDFVAAKATTAARAIAYEAADPRTFRRLCGYGAIVDDGAGRYHLDAGRLGAFRGAVRKRAAAIAATSGLVASAAAAATVFVLAE